MRQSELFIDEARLFEALCTVERLEQGFRRVRKNKGSPGIDGVTIVEFESPLNEELSQLTEELQSWTYKPSPVRRVEIPKSGAKGIRLLGVPTVRDRVLHATLKALLEPIFEPLFSDHSYGFRRAISTNILDFPVRVLDTNDGIWCIPLGVWRKNRNVVDLESKLSVLGDYYHNERVHSGIGGATPFEIEGGPRVRPANLNSFRWKTHCRGVYQLPEAA
jgi:hypothetical protein